MKGSFARLLARSVTYDPSVPGRLYMTGGKYGTAGRTPYRSDDGGRTFTPLTIPQVLQWDRSEPKLVHCVDLIIDPSSPPEARTLYVVTTVGLFKSTDGGVQWREIGRDLHRSLFLASWINEGPRCLSLHPEKPQTLYFFSNGRTSKNAATNAAGAYMSDDGGETWLRLAREQVGSVASFSQSQSHPENLYVVAAAPGTANIGVTTSTRLWHSADSGRTWRAIETPSAHISGAYIHPRNPALLYLLTHTIKDPVTEPTALFRSRDRGATWELVHAPGLTISLSPFASNGITFSPHDDRRLFLLTSAGVWDIIDPLAK